MRTRQLPGVLSGVGLMIFSIVAAGEEVVEIGISGLSFVPEEIEFFVGDSPHWSGMSGMHYIVQTNGFNSCARLLDGFMSGAEDRFEPSP